MESVECVIVGAGVVGLAIARELAGRGHETLVLERHDHYGTEISSRNSEVIHSGLYYPPNSLKARTCLRGRQLLYDYCRLRGIAHRRYGKLVVATTEAQLDTLGSILRSAHANGADDVRQISAAEAQALEPEVACVGALLCPSTGIVDSHELMTSLVGAAEASGAAVAYRTSVDRVQIEGDGCVVETEDGTRLRARWLVNSAGLGAVDLARRMVGPDASRLPRASLAKGTYFSLAGRSPFSRLVYPMPEPGGLGVHLTLDLAGQARFGPDGEWIDAIDYDVDPRRAERFYGAIRRYWPGIEGRSLQASYAGIRPKITGPGEPAADFRIDGPEVHGAPGLVNLLGIESPGLTVALAIAEHVAGLIDS